MAELEETLGEAELHEWAVFYGLEPWGAEAAFLRAGIIAATVVNAAPNRKRGAKAASPKDFMPQVPQGAPAVGVSSKQLRTQLLSVFGERVRKGDGDGELQDRGRP